MVFYRRSIFIVLLVIILFSVANAFNENLGDIDTTSDINLTNPIDTLGAVTIFFVTGDNPCACRYADSCNFRSERSVIPASARMLYDTTRYLSVPTYVRTTSRDKLFIKRGIVLPPGDIAYDSWTIPGHLLPPADIADVIAQADEDVDFGLYDLTGIDHIPDGYVDFVFFVDMNQWHVGGTIPYLDSTYLTADTNSLGMPVYIGDPGNTALVYSWNFQDENPWDTACAEVRGSYDALLGLHEHEFMHSLNYIPDTDHIGETTYNHTAMGGFCGMTGGFVDRMSPVNPYFRDTYINWIQPIVVEYAPRYSALLEYDIASDTSAFLLQDDAVSLNQGFYVTRHKFGQGNYFQRTWPTPDSAGVMIWHVDRGRSSWSDRRRKPMDVEAAIGLYDWTFGADTVMNINSPNTSMGLDSLDVRGVYNNSPTGGAGSAKDFFSPYGYTEFTDATNPNSNFYKSTSSDSQVVKSRIAVRNIRLESGTVKADLLVNNWYGQLAASTTWGDTTHHTGYAITGDITVPAGDTLRIRRGTTIYFQKHEDNQSGGAADTLCEIIVYGTLIAQGTASDSILFVPSSEQLGSAGNGDWYGIRFEEGSKGVMEYCAVRNAEIGIEMRSNANLTASHCNISNNSVAGVYNYKGYLNLTNSKISYNGIYGLYGYMSLDTVSSNYFLENAEYGINIYSRLGTTSSYIFADTVDRPSAQASHYGIYVSANSSVNIHKCKVGRYDQGGIGLNNSSMHITNCYIWQNGDNGIYAEYNSSPKIRQSTITDALCGIRTYYASSPDIGISPDSGNCSILYCTDYFIFHNYYMMAFDTLKAQNNWYGSASPNSRKFYAVSPAKIKYLPCLGSAPAPPKLDTPAQIPYVFSLNQNYPNPFNPETKISFTLDEQAFTMINIFNIMGQRVNSLVNDYLDPGSHTIIWNGKNKDGLPVSSGVYFYTIQSGDHYSSKKMTILR